MAARGWQGRWRHRVAVVEAAVLLTVGGAAQRWVPLPRWSRVLGVTAPVPAGWRGRSVGVLSPHRGDERERQVARAVRSAARRLPFTPSCLAEAFAGQVLLRGAGAPGVVVIGLRRPPGDAAGSGSAGWEAHAWLLGAHGAITGGPAAKGFTAGAVFEVPGGLAAADVALPLALGDG